MGTVAYLAGEIERGLRHAHPQLRMTLAPKLAAAVAAAIRAQTANTAAWAAVLSIEWLRGRVWGYRGMKAIGGKPKTIAPCPFPEGSGRMEAA